MTTLKSTRRLRVARTDPASPDEEVVLLSTTAIGHAAYPNRVFVNAVVNPVKRSSLTIALISLQV